MTHRRVAITICIVLSMYFSAYVVTYGMDQYEEWKVSRGYIDRPEDCIQSFDDTDRWCDFIDDEGAKCVYSVGLSRVMNCYKPSKGYYVVDDGEIKLVFNSDDHDVTIDLEDEYEIAPSGFPGYGLTQEL